MCRNFQVENFVFNAVAISLSLSRSLFHFLSVFVLFCRRNYFTRTTYWKKNCNTIQVVSSGALTKILFINLKKKKK